MRLFAVLLLSGSLFAQAHYRYNGAALENDLKYTPGAVRTTDVKSICDTRTGTLRDVTVATRKKVFIEYGVPWSRRASMETDHLLSLEIGGTNDITNLWPQPYVAPGAHQKDLLENLLHKMICDGQITPADAQHQISTDWYSAYQKYVLPSDVKLGR